MKIWIVTHTYPTVEQPYLQPFIRDQVNVISAMESYEARVLVASPLLVPFTGRWKRNRSSLLDSEIAKRFSYLSIPKRLFPAFTGRNLTHKLLQELPNKNSLVHIHWLYPNALAVPQLKQAGYRTIINVHGTDWHSTKNDPRFSSLLKDVLTNSDLIIVSGNEIKNEILERYPGLTIHVSFNYVDTTLFRFPDESRRIEAKKQLGFDPEKLNILTIANVRPEKGIDIYLDAIAKINRSDICFHLVGQPAKGSYAELIKDKLKAIPSGMLKIHSPVPRNQIPAYYYAADAYLLPSRSEGFNVSLLEALATGLPVAATDTGGASKVLQDERGRLMEAGSTGSVVATIEALIEKPLPERSIKSRKYINDNYSMQHYSDFLSSLYSEFIHGS